MHPYQRIIHDGVVVQEGVVDTQAKFAQLTDGLDLKGKTYIDVGCNLGEMVHLATDAGMTAAGCDASQTVLAEARGLHPDLEFHHWSADAIVGRYDILTATGLLHYILDLPKTLAHFAKVADCVCCDVWLTDEEKPGLYAQRTSAFTDYDPTRFIPNRGAWELIAGRHFKKVRCLGPTESPDASSRFAYRLSDPVRARPRAIVIYGPPASGKTTTAAHLTREGFMPLSTDMAYVHMVLTEPGWRRMPLYIKDVIDDDGLLVAKREELLDHHRCYFAGWIGQQYPLDVVIEGYALIYDPLRAWLVDYLERAGYATEERKLRRIGEARRAKDTVVLGYPRIPLFGG